MSTICQHCDRACKSCVRCDLDVDVSDLEGHEGRGGLYRILAAEGGQTHE